MRAADAQECWAMGVEPKVALARSHSQSSSSTIVYHANVRIAEWGWRGTEVGGAEVWCLTFAGADEHRVFFARQSRTLCTHLLERFPVIWCHVSVDHKASLKWLRWLGFVARGARMIGYGEFLRMERRRWAQVQAQG